MYMITHPETELMVATLTRMRTGRRWMLMLWDGHGCYRETQWHSTRKEALAEMLLHCQRIGVPWPAL